MVTVYFATNRNPRPVKTPRNFGKHFSPEGLSDLRFGKAEVKGNQVRVVTHPEKLVKRADTNFTDVQHSVFGSQKLFDEMRKVMHSHERDTIVFLHGYNVSFKEAMKSAAKLAHNFAKLNGGKGVNVACFSWPSDGSMKPGLA